MGKRILEYESPNSPPDSQWGCFEITLTILYPIIGMAALWSIFNPSINGLPELFLLIVSVPAIFLGVITFRSLPRGCLALLLFAVLAIASKMFQIAFVLR